MWNDEGGVELFWEDRHHALAQRIDALCVGALRELARHDESRDESEQAHAYLELFAREGVLTFVVPSDEGRLDVRAISLARERIARVSAFADVMFVMQGLGTAPVGFGGSDALRERVLNQARAGRPMAFAVTEDGAGSDLQGITTAARRDGDHWVLNGEKVFISNAGVAAGYSVFARDEEASARDGKPRASAFYVPADAVGLTTEAFQGMSPHPIGRVSLANVRVPDADRIGEPGRATEIAFRTLAHFRVTVGAAALGMAMRALAEARAHVTAREQFGRPLARFQLVQAKLSDSLAELEAARLLVARAARAVDTGSSSRYLSSAAKMLATETAQTIVDRCVQLFGGRGVMRGSIVERLYRDVRALRIYEGTTEIHQLIIAREWMTSED
ncbi:MAG: acyl-CoA dehydrogenase [Planctomycetes bacterium]|nr:acyl-CoA dehydrogenase [Planctomycetota bacterium]